MATYTVCDRCQKRPEKNNHIGKFIFGDEYGDAGTIGADLCYDCWRVVFPKIKELVNAS